ncbi:hypothetical protein AB6A40_002292 [Gnathostoma spinigerum]|uniref:WD repeat-containing protein 89 n=1 Tax=Gnathostoma spinigerum TaxID=75299 RepID=A0ABD6EFB0_9BILA
MPSLDDSLFSWEAPFSSYIDIIQPCDSNRVIVSLKNGSDAALCMVDIETGKTVNSWEKKGIQFVSFDFYPKERAGFAIDNSGHLWTIDSRCVVSEHIALYKSSMCNEIVTTASVSSDGYTIAVSRSVQNLNYKKKQKKSGGGDRESDSDSDSNASEPFIYSVDIFDVRNASSLTHSYVESHSDTIQCLQYSSESSHLLLSGGADGLFNIFDVRRSESDDGLQSTNQVESSISRVGFLDYSRAYVITDDNLAELFKINSPIDVDVLTRIKSHQSQFMVDIFSCDHDNYILSLESSGDGIATVYSISNDGRTEDENSTAKCHEDLIRCSSYNPAHYMLFTGGEDGRLVGRKLTPSLRLSPIAKQRKHKKTKFRPY